MTSAEVSVVLVPLNSCLVTLPASFIYPIVNSTNVLVQQVLTTIHTTPTCTLGWSGFTSSKDSTIELDPLYAKTIGLNEGDKLIISLDLPSILNPDPFATSVELEPLSVADWELTELYAQSIEDKFLSQVRCVTKNQVLVVRTNSGVVNFSVKSIKNTSTEVLFSRVGNTSELHIVPKPHLPSSLSKQKAKKTLSSKKSSVVNSKMGKIYRSSICQGDEILIYGNFNDEFVLVKTIEGPGTPLSAKKISDKEREMGFNKEMNSLVAKVVNDTKSGNNVKISKKLAICLGLEGSVGELLYIEQIGIEIKGKIIVNPFVIDSDFINNNGTTLQGNDEQADNKISMAKQIQKFLWENWKGQPITHGMKLPKMKSLEYGGFIEIETSFDNKGLRPWMIIDDEVDVIVKGDELLPKSRVQLDENNDEVIVVGQDKLLKNIRKNLKYGVPTYMYGKSGSGKSLIVTQMENEMKQNDVFVKLIDFDKDLDEYIEGDQKESKDRTKKIMAIFNSVISMANWHSPSLVILENLDKIIPKESEQGDGSSNKLTEFIIEKFNASLKFNKFGLLITGKSKDSINQLIFQKHLIDEEINLTAPNKDQRQQILEFMLTKRFPQFSQDLTFLSDTVHETEGYYPSDFTNLIDRVYHDLITNSETQFTESNFMRAISGYTPTSLRGVKLQKKDAGAKWSDIGGMLEPKQILIETLEWPTKFAPIFENCPLRLRSGILLYGYPGCGKTMLASAIGDQTGLNFISVKGPEILNKYIGASEQNIREIFERASAAKPCVLFFDEFDSIAPKRGHDSTGVTDRIVNQLLTQMDGAEGLDGVYVIGATSRPDLIDSALLRPGRLDKSVLCDLPDKINRRDMFHTIIKSNGFELAEGVELDELVEKSEGFTGADLQALIYNAYLKSVNDSLEADKGIEKTTTIESDNVEYKLLPGLKLDNRSAQRKQISLGKKITTLLNNNEKLNKEVELAKPKIFITSAHLQTSLQETKPSISKKELLKFKTIYSKFQDSKRPSEMKSGEASNEVGVRESLM